MGKETTQTNESGRRNFGELSVEWTRYPPDGDDAPQVECGLKLFGQTLDAFTLSALKPKRDFAVESRGYPASGTLRLIFAGATGQVPGLAGDFAYGSSTEWQGAIASWPTGDDLSARPGATGSRSFGDFNLSWVAQDVGRDDGRTVDCELGLFGNPLDSCQLTEDGPRYGFELSLRGEQASGYLELRIAEAEERATLVGDFTYSAAARFSGNVVLWGAEEDVDDGDVEDVDGGAVDGTAGGDLLHFTYPRRLQPLDQEAVEREFIVYDEDSAFFQALVSARSGGQRAKLEHTALALVRGDSPYAGRFVARVAELEAPMNRFSAIELRLRAEDPCRLETGEQLAKSLETELGIELASYLTGDAYQQEKQKAWDSFLALAVVMGPWPELLDALTRVLVACRLLERLNKNDQAFSTSRGVAQAVRATVILPSKVFPLPPWPAEDSQVPSQDPAAAGSGLPPAPQTAPEKTPEPAKATSEPSPGWIEPLGIADLKLVRRRLLRYQLGEVASIESLLAGERKDRSRKKSTEERSSQIDARHSTDAQESHAAHGSRSGLGQPLERVTRAFDIDTQNPIEQSYKSDGLSVSTSGKWTETFDTQLEGRNVTDYAREMTQGSTRRALRSVREERTRKLLEAREEIMEHRFDNRDGSAPLIGIYRWVDKVYRAAVEGCGRRLIIELVVLEPAAAYLRRKSRKHGITLPRPVSPDQLSPAVASWQDVTRDNYANLAMHYHAKGVGPPPAATRTLVAALTPASSTAELEVPAGYVAQSAKVAYIFSKDEQEGDSASAAGDSGSSDSATGRSASSQGSLGVLIGEQCFHYATGKPNPGTSDAISLNGEGERIPVAVLSTYSPTYVNVEVVCKLIPATLEAWQQRTYQAIVDAYEAQLKAYLERGEEPEGAGELAGRDQILARRRATVVRELRRMAILRLMEQRSWSPAGAGATATSAGGPAPAATVTARRHHDQVDLYLIQLFDRAFEWAEMTYTFYPFPWDAAAEEKPYWIAAETAVPDGENPIDEFLNAGSARILVAVHPACEMTVLYYLISGGQIWQGEGELAPTLSDWVPLVRELKRLPEANKADREQTWEIEEPTSLIMLQQGDELPRFAATLRDEGIR